MDNKQVGRTDSFGKVVCPVWQKYSYCTFLEPNPESLVITIIAYLLHYPHCCDLAMKETVLVNASRRTSQRHKPGDLRHLHYCSWYLRSPTESDGMFCKLRFVLNDNRCTRWRSWLRRCATNWKVAGSIPDGVIGIFLWHNPSGRLTLPLTEMRDISWWCKGGRCVGLITLSPSCADCLEIWEPQPPGNHRVCPGL